MSFIPQEVINEIRSKTDIVEIISLYVPLSKQGSNYSASCPFHEDRNPSFSVSQSKQIYKCFSCQRGGNVFNFIQEIDGISFPEAVKKVAELNHLEFNFQVASDENRPHEFQKIYEIHQHAQDFYHYYLMKTVNGEPALNYLLNRGFTRETLEVFSIGLAPENSQLLIEYLRQKKYSENDLVESGIFIPIQQGEFKDRFRGRITIPLKNAQGKPVAFSGRIFLKSDKSGPKYLNSSETEIFNKSQLIYNFDLARPQARKYGKILVCEGYMDVMALHQNGITHTVATMGTALTEYHAKTLSKTVNEIYFIFDGDEAGQKATIRAFDIFKTFPQVKVRSVQIPQQMDPDEWIKINGVQSFNNLLAHAQTSYEFEKDYYKKEFNLNDKQSTAAYIEKLLDLIVFLPSSIEQELRLQDLANEFDININLLKEQFARLDYKNSKPPSYKDTFHNNSELVSNNLPDFSIDNNLAYNSEKQLLFNLVFYEEAWQFLENLNQPLILFHESSQKLFFMLQSYYYDEGNPLPLTGLMEKIEDTTMSQMFSSILWEMDKTYYNNQIMVDCIAIIERAFIAQEIKELKVKVKEYQRMNNQSAVHKLLQEIMYKTRQIKPGGHINE